MFIASLSLKNSSSGGAAPDVRSCRSSGAGVLKGEACYKHVAPTELGGSVSA